MRRAIPVLVLLASLATVASAGENVLGRLQEEIRRLARESRPAVVKVTAAGEQALHVMPDLRKVGGLDIRALLQRSSTVGTGFLVSSDGVVLTSDRIARSGTEARVEFPNGTIRVAKILGHDALFQIAVLKVEPVEGIQPLTLCSGECPPGSLGLLVGNGLGVAGSMSLGIVTAAGESARSGDEYDNYLVMNTPVRPGDAGAPFLDPEGRVVGMAVGSYSSTARIVASSKGVRFESSEQPAGMGYLVPARDLRFALEEIRDHGSVRRGRLGVRVNVASLKVGDVLPDTPAAAAGFLTGDILVGMDDRDLSSFTDLRHVLQRVCVGANVSVRIRRGEKVVSLTCRVQGAPPAISGLPLMEDEDGVVRIGVLKPAYVEIGIREGDILKRINDHEVDSLRSAAMSIIKAFMAPRVRLTLLRGDEEIEVTLPTR